MEEKESPYLFPIFRNTRENKRLRVDRIGAIETLFPIDSTRASRSPSFTKRPESIKPQSLKKRRLLKTLVARIARTKPGEFPSK